MRCPCVPQSLTNQELASIKALDCRRMKSVTLPILFDPTKGADGLRDALNGVRKSRRSSRTEQNVLILSDRESMKIMHQFQRC